MTLEQPNFAEYEDAPIELQSAKARDKINFGQNLNKSVLVPSVQDAGFQCKDCNEIFKDSSAYLDHINSRRRKFI